MNINLFFIIIIGLLLSVFILFRPLKIELPDHKEIAQLELKDFQIYELNEQGVKSILEGNAGKRYENRYEVVDVSFKDATEEYIQMMHADHGRYQDDIIYLKDNVFYTQDNNITFKSDEAKYDVNTSTVTTQGAFTMRLNDHYFKGQQLKFNIKENKVLAKKVSGSYQLEEK